MEPQICESNAEAFNDQVVESIEPIEHTVTLVPLLFHHTMKRSHLTSHTLILRKVNGKICPFSLFFNKKKRKQKKLFVFWNSLNSKIIMFWK
jgi:hypothetical protein